MIADDFHRRMPSKRAIRVGAFGSLLLEVGESLLNLFRHGHVDSARFVVPTEVTVAGPFDGEGLEGLEGGCEVLVEHTAGALDSGVDNNQTTTKLKRTGQV
jgi:hypothetical protein